MKTLALAPAQRTAVSLALLSTAFVATGCGVGLAGGASAASSGGDSTPAPSRLVTGESMPVLSRDFIPAPILAGQVITGVVSAEPSDEIRLQFSDPIDQAYSMSSFEVDILRPDPDNQTVGDWVTAPVAAATSATARSVTLRLAGATLHNSVYRVRLSGLMTAGSAVSVPSSTTYFVVRDGEWQDEELISLGGGVTGGITLTEDDEAYATFESETPISTGGTLWGTWLLASELDSPWRFPVRVYSRNAQGLGETDTQLQTSRFLINDDVGMVRINESSNNVPDAEYDRNILRAAVGLNVDVEDYPMSRPYVDGDPLGLQFGPLVEISDTDELEGRVDKPGAPELAGPHFSYNGQFTAHGHSVGVAFWATSGPLTGGRFEHQRVYSNETTAADFTGNIDDIRWADWGDARLLSAPGEDHNSWPIRSELPDGSAVAIWWSAASIEEVLGDSVDDYWLAQWSATGGWTQAVNVTPAGMAGALPPITDTEIAVDDSGNPHLIAFSRSLVPATNPSLYLPSARILDLASVSTTPDWQDPTFARPVGGAAGYTIDSELSYTDYLIKTYREQLNDARRNTPRATTMGNNEFLTSWLDVSQAATIPFVSIYKASIGGISEWESPVDLTSLVTSSGGTGSASGVSLTVDQNGWATLMFIQDDPMSGSGNGQVFAKRTNLPFGGTAGFGLGGQAEMISSGSTDITNITLSNSLSSGSFSLSWDYIIPNTPSLGGSALSRFR